MFVSRRSFLISAGSALTATFLKEARAFALETESPLLVPPQHNKQTLFFEEVEDYWRLHLGEPEFEIPEPPRLIDSIRWLGTVGEWLHRARAIRTHGWLRLGEPVGTQLQPGSKGLRIPGNARCCAEWTGRATGGQNRLRSLSEPNELRALGGSPRSLVTIAATGTA